MPGPLPSPAPRRRNGPTIPTTELPAEGRRGRSPISPYKLGKAGRAWWSWAWHLPQACAWSDADLYVVARRARLEDDDPSPAILREMGALDDRLGLNPKAMAQLRWRIVETVPTGQQSATSSHDGKVTSLRDRRAALGA